MKLSRKNKGGFTLIELMVSVSIFIIVAFVVTGTFIVAMDAYRKAQQVRLVIDNVNYAMDAMVLEIREGTNYTGDGTTFSFNNNDTGFLPQHVTYEFVGADKTICRQVDTGECQSLTDPKIATIDNLNFKLFSSPDGSRPPMVRINVYGVVKIGKTSSNFNIQTTVTQRNSDNL